MSVPVFFRLNFACVLFVIRQIGRKPGYKKAAAETPNRAPRALAWHVSVIFGVGKQLNAPTIWADAPCS